MANKSYLLQIGSLLFDKNSITYITSGLFLLGAVVGLFNIININNFGTSSTGIISIFSLSAIPTFLIIRGFLKATVVDE